MGGGGGFQRLPPPRSAQTRWLCLWTGALSPPSTGSCLWARAAAHLGYKPSLAPQVPWDRTASQEPGLSQPPDTCPCHSPHSLGSPSPLSELSQH